jgi:hypothetical protein
MQVGFQILQLLIHIYQNSSMNIVENSFKEKAIIRNGMMLFSKENSLDFVKACESHNIKVLGIDGFYLYDDKIQPSMENSVDFTSAYYKIKGKNIFADAQEFLISKDTNLFFEITCSR